MNSVEKSVEELEKELERLRPYFEKVEGVKRRLQNENVEMLKFVNDIEALLRKNVKYSAEDIASSLGIGRATLFYRLKNIGLTLEDVRKAVLYEYMLEAQRKVKKKEIKHLPPKDFSEFMQREVVQEVKKRCLQEAFQSHTWRTLCTCGISCVSGLS
jgi:hypothetical protein